MAVQTHQAGAQLVGIARRAASGAPMEELKDVGISVESGLAGDHRGRHRNRKVTVLGQEDWLAACAALGADLPWTVRRANLFVRGLDLPRLAGARLAIGPVLLEVYEECAPCAVMEKARAGLRGALLPDWRGGIAARVLQGGQVSLGDTVRRLTD